MTMLKPLTFSSYLLAGTALVAIAIPMMANAAEDKDDGSTSVQLSADAHKMVEQDRVTATLAMEATSKTAAETQAMINGKMQDAQKLYSKVSGVKPTTGSYSVYKEYDTPEPAPKKDGTPAWTPEEREQHSVWRGYQEIQLDGVKSDDLLKLIGALQKQGFAAKGLNFYMSREAQDKVKDVLIVEALGNIKARAENIRQALGMKTIRYAKIDLSDNGNVVRPMPMMMKAARAEAFDAAAPMPDPVAEAGETDVTVNVTAEVRLK